METVVLIVLILVVMVIVLPLRAIVVSGDARQKAAELEREIILLKSQLRELLAAQARRPAAPEASPAASAEPRVAVVPEPRAPASGPPVTPPSAPTLLAPAPPPLPPHDPSPRPPTGRAPLPALTKPPAAPPFQFEQFLGKRLFAWVGGLGLFIGVLLLVKYAFDAGFFPPVARVTMGFLTGSALLAGGLLMRRPELRILAHTLAATGILVLYGMCFAAHSLYHFAAFTPESTFAFMALITAVAFLTALRLPSLTVALLGLLGGFLTPPLLSTGEDRPGALFGYIALLDVGLLLLAARGRWPFLAVLAAGATWFMQAGWMNRFFFTGAYDTGPATLIPMAVFAGFGALFTTAAVWRSRRTPADPAGSLWTGSAALGLWFSAIVFSFLLLKREDIALRPWLLHAFTFLANAGALHAALFTAAPSPLARFTAGTVFAHVALWLFWWLPQDSLATAMGLILVFAALNTAAPLYLFRGVETEKKEPLAPWMPVAGVALIMLCLMPLPALSFAVWPVAGLLNLALLALLPRRGGIWPLAVSAVLTAGGMLVWLARSERSAQGLKEMTGVIALCAAFFVGCGVFLLRRRAGDSTERDDPSSQALTIASAALPYALICLVLVWFPIPDPSLVFALSLGLAAVLLGLGRWLLLPWLAPPAALLHAAIGFSWHIVHFRSGDPATAWTPLLWHLGATALFVAWPFTRRRGAVPVLEWIALALAVIAQGILTYLTVRGGWPQAGALGLVPAAFAVLMGGVLAAYWRITPMTAEQRTRALAWLAGAALLFVTLIFPVQFQRHWLTIGWALEGAALCWLHRRVRHDGLIQAAALLLGAVFVRLVVNPAVIHSYFRSGTPVWNWLLYTYGLSAASAFLAARWLRPSDFRFGESIPLRPLLIGMGGVMLFVLLNLEIADWFTRPDMRTIDLKNRGVFAQSMVTSIGWAVFAIVCVGLGLWKNAPVARYAGAGLLAVTLGKLFLHDLAAIESIYRIAAFLAVSVMTLGTAWLYQRFLNPPENGAAESDGKAGDIVPPSSQPPAVPPGEIT